MFSINNLLFYKLVCILLAFQVFNLSAEAPNQDIIIDSDEPECLIELILGDVFHHTDNEDNCENQESAVCLKYNDTEYCDDFAILKAKSAILEIIISFHKIRIPEWNDVKLNSNYPPPQL